MTIVLQEKSALPAHISARPVIVIAGARVERHPFAHYVVDGVFEDEFYKELADSFPDCPPNSGPTGFTIHRGDPLFDAVIGAHDAWRMLYDYCNSAAFVEAMTTLFADDIAHFSKIADTEISHIDYVETRAEKQKVSIDHHGFEAGEMFIRFDFMQGREAYGREQHLDHRRRLATLLLYFDEPGPGSFEGGELILHDRKGRQIRSIAPRENRAVMFACSEHSLHSVRPVRDCILPRRFVQVSVSSCHDLWEGEKPSITAHISRLGKRLRNKIIR